MGDRPLKSPPRRVGTLFLSFPASYGSKLDSQCHKEIESLNHDNEKVTENAVT